VVIIYFLALFFLAGALVGWIVGKIKGGKQPQIPQKQITN